MTTKNFPHRANSTPNAIFESPGRRRVRSAGIWATSVTALVTLTAAVSLAFITVAQAQQQKRPGASAAPAARPAPPAPRAIARPSFPSPQRSVSRPPPPQRTAIPNRPVKQPQTATTRVRPITPPQRAVIPNGPIVTPRIGQRTIPPGPHGGTQVGHSPTGLKFGPHGPIVTSAHLRQGPNALRPVRPKFPVVTATNRYFPILTGQKF